MTAYRLISLYLWIGPHALLGVVLALMLRRRSYREFPIYFSYLLFELIQFCILIALGSIDSVSLSTYTQADFLARVGSMALRFGVIQELFQSPLSNSPPLRRTFARRFSLASVIVVTLASMFIALLCKNVFNASILAPYVIEQALDTAQCALVVAIFVWHHHLGARMSNAVFGIAAGLGLLTALEPALHAVRYLVGTEFKLPNIVSLSVFHVSVLIWLYFIRAEVRRPLGTVIPATDVRAWTDELGRFSQP